MVIGQRHQDTETNFDGVRCLGKTDIGHEDESAGKIFVGGLRYQNTQPIWMGFDSMAINDTLSPFDFNYDPDELLVASSQSWFSSVEKRPRH